MWMRKWEMPWIAWGGECVVHGLICANFKRRYRVSQKMRRGNNVIPAMLQWDCSNGYIKVS